MNVNPLKSSNDDINAIDEIKFKTSVKGKRMIRKSFPLMPIVLTSIAIIGIGAAVFFYFQYNQLKQNPTQTLDAQSKEIKDNVGRLIYINNPDDYTVAAITNIDLLKKENEDFFKNAKNGDYLIISQTDKRAILYDKDKNILLNVGPVIDDSSTQTTPTVSKVVSTTAPVYTTTVPTTSVPSKR